MPAAKSAPWAAAPRAVVGFPAVAVLLAVIATVDSSQAQGLGVASPQRSPFTSRQTDLSRVLFHELLLPFEVTSVLILIAILGAVALARRTATEKGRTSKVNLLQQDVPLTWYLLLSAALFSSGRRRLSHQAQSDHGLHVD